MQGPFNVHADAIFTTAITHAGKLTPLFTVEAELMIIAMVPCPVVLGIAIDIKAILTGS